MAGARRGAAFGFILATTGPTNRVWVSTPSKPVAIMVRPTMSEPQ